MKDLKDFGIFLGISKDFGFRKDFTRISGFSFRISKQGVRDFRSEMPLALIDSRHIFFFDSGTYLYIFSDLKVQRDRPCFVITLPSESERDCLKTVELLQLYLTKTRLNRKHPRLFLSCRPPYKPVTTDTLARWIRSVMHDAGIDISVFGAHSVRGASASFALQNNASIDSILQCGDWSCLKTFSRHYNRVNKYLSSGELAKVFVHQRDNTNADSR